MRKELFDYFNFLAYCLMPNHFHFLVYTKENLNESSDVFESSGDYSFRISKQIAILLRSYTRAINIQEERTGSLFQQKTKAKCLNDLNNSRNNYIKTCFFYIHQNPFTAGLVSRLEDWKYSSLQEYCGQSSVSLCNQSLAFEMINFDRNNLVEQTYAAINERNLKGIWI
jgi:putative transposase